MTDATLEQLAEIATAPDWSQWGAVTDRQALIGIITSLQRQDLNVRVSNNRSPWTIWIQRKAEP